ncbi:MAG: DUF6428 family protein [Pseudomonadota bacterium]
MTPQEMLTALNALPREAALIFETGDGEIAGGYHVTEWKVHDVRSIDCGATMAAWTEVSLQLLDGAGGDLMSVGRFASILAQSLAKLDGLGESAMQVEFAHGNLGKRIYHAAVPVLDGDRVVVALTDQHALCKPAEAFRAAWVARTHRNGPTGRTCC